MVLHRRRLTRGERKAEIREQLVVSADALFLRRGFHAATLDEIAAELGVTKGALYSNFASKTDLFLAVLDARLERRHHGVTRRRSTASDLEELVREHARAISRDDPDGRWASVLAEAWTVAAGDEAFRRALLERQDRINAVIAEAIEQIAQRANVEFLYPPLKVTPIAGAFLRGLLLQRLLDPKRMPTEVIEEAFAAFIRGMVRPVSSVRRRDQ